MYVSIYYIIIYLIIELFIHFINNKYPNGKLLILTCGARANFEKYKGLDETL